MPCDKASMACGELTRVTIDTLPIQPGYWRANELSNVTLKCYPKEACVGSNESTERDELFEYTENLWCVRYAL